MVPETPFTVRFGKLEQGRSPKNTVFGSMLELINVRQRKLGRYSKRYGCSKLNRTTDSGSITSGTGLASTVDALVLYADDTLWVRDETNSQWLNKGVQSRSTPTDTLGVDGFGNFPYSVITGTKVYVFTYTGSTIYYRVLDLATGVEKLARTAVTASGAVLRMKPVVAGGFVWFYFQDGATTVKVGKLNPASLSTAAVVTTYFTKTGGTATQITWDVVATTGGTVAFVAAAGFSATGIRPTGAANDNYWLSMLDTATGGVAAAPGWVHYTLHAVVGFTSATYPIAWLNYSGANGNLYFVSNPCDGDAGSFELVQLDAANLSGATALWRMPATAAADGSDKSLCGYLEGNDRYVYLSSGSNGAGANTQRSAEDATITRYAWNTADVVGGPATATTWKRGAYVASAPFKISSTWYLVTGHDDYDDAQRSYVCRNALTGKIVGGAMYGRGGKVFQRGAFAPSSSASEYSNQCPPSVDVSGNKAYMALSQSDGGDAYQTRFVTWDFADTYGRLLTFLNKRLAVLPGPWAGRLTAQDSAVNELVPAMSPSTPTITTGAGGSLAAGTYGVKCVYAQYDASGAIYRSGESPAVSIAAALNDEITPVCRTNKLTNRTDGWVEFYVSSGGSYYLAAKVANDPTVSTVATTISAMPAAGAEILYTDNGTLSNFPQPSFHFAFTWNERLFIGGTDFDDVSWFTKEFQPGVGPEFSSALKVRFTAGHGGIKAGGALSQDAAVLFKADAACAILGRGPDDTGGGGGFQVVNVDAPGCTNPASVATFPGGVLYQGADGNICRVGLDLKGVVLRAAEDYVSGATVQAAEHFEKDGEVRFYLSNGKVAVYDYASANEAAPDGYWSEDSSGTWGAGYGACVHGNIPHFVDSSGVVWKDVVSQYFDDASTQIKHVVEFTPLMPADLGGQFACRELLFLGEFVGNHTFKMSAGPSGGTLDAKTVAVTAAPEEFLMMPAGCELLRAMRIRIEEDTSANLTGGFECDGVRMLIQVDGGLGGVNAGQRL